MLAIRAVLILLGLILAVCGPIFAQQPPPAYVVLSPGCIYNASGGFDTPWPSANFSVGGAASGISSTASFGSNGGTIAVRLSHNGTNYWRSICFVNVYMRG